MSTVESRLIRTKNPIFKLSRIFCGGALALGFLSAPAFANALHGFCFSPTPACSDNGSNTPTATNPPNFGFAYSTKGTAPGDYLLAFLVPNMSDPTSIIVSGGSASPVTAALYSPTAWTSGKLTNYLGINASPANPIGGYNQTTSGYFVYLADLGINTLTKVGTLGGPDLSLNTALPIDSYIVAFLGDGENKYIATANSGAILETGTPISVPEPGSFWLLGTSLMGLGLLMQRKKRGG